MSIERVLLPDNILDRIEELERQLAELKAGAVTVQVVQVPEGGSGSGLNGWIATGSAFSDLLGRIVLDASSASIRVAEGGRIFSADYQSGVSGFKIDGGVAEFNNVTVRGTIHASAGSIGGWTIASGHLYAGSGSSRTGLRPADYPFYAGAEDPASAPFRVTPAGALTATNATVTGTIYASAGHFSGTVTVGTSAPYIQIDGANKRIRTSTYAAGLQGFNLDGVTGNAEFNNVDIRGALKASVFEYSQMLVTGGTLIIAKGAGKLYADCTSVDSPNTFNVDIEDPDGLSHAAAGALWAVDDIIRLKDALVGDLWATISSKTDMTTYWRLAVVKQSPGAGTNYTFRKGMAVVNYGQGGQGFLMMTADQTNAPFYSVRTHAGSPWSAQTELARIGNLAGNWGYSSATYGIALGEYASGKANLTWDPTNGLRLRTYTTTVLQLDNAGSARIQGVLNIGTSGGIYQGTGTFSSPGTGLKIWNDSGVGRLATYNNGTPQVYFDTNGRLVAGGVTLDNNGITVEQGGVGTYTAYINFSGGGFIKTYSSMYYGGMAVGYLGEGIGIVRELDFCGTPTRQVVFKVSLSVDGSAYARGIIIDDGALFVGSPANNTELVGKNEGDICYYANLRPVRAGTTYTGYIYVPLATTLTHTSLDGDPLNVGTYTVGPVGSGANFEFDYPSAARAVAVRIAARWSSSNDGYVAYVRPPGSGYAHVAVRAMVAGRYTENAGPVAADDAGKIELVVGGADASNVWLTVCGYFL